MKCKIPVSVAALVNQIVPGSHASLNALFKQAGAPGEPPELSHATKWKVWLLRTNDDPCIENPLIVLGKIIEEYMEVDLPPDNLLYKDQNENRSKLARLLGKHGMQYRTGGRIEIVTGGPPAASLEEILREKKFDEVEIEFQRTLDDINLDPGKAATAACSLLEALFRAYLEAHDIPLPDKITIKPLWASLQKELGLDPKNQADQDVQRILGGMSSIVDGIGSFRTHAGSAHGGGKLRYHLSKRHALLAVNAAHTLAAFIIATWEQRDNERKNS
jgi:hypothetical protein